MMDLFNEDRAGTKASPQEAEIPEEIPISQFHRFRSLVAKGRHIGSL